MNSKEALEYRLKGIRKVAQDNDWTIQEALMVGGPYIVSIFISGTNGSDRPLTLSQVTASSAAEGVLVAYEKAKTRASELGISPR